MVKLDATDLKILYHLQLNGRISNLELSQKIGLSPAPTLERVKKLENLKIINGYQAILNKEKLDLGISVFVNIRLNKQSDNEINSFKNKVNKYPEIVECYKIAGRFDFLLKITVKDIASFERFISSELSAMSEVNSTETMLIISEVKNNVLLPLKYPIEK
jgi:Lrp/AsnC family transcriptional regulator, leucine-responsive regulatory protein